MKVVFLYSRLMFSMSKVTSVEQKSVLNINHTHGNDYLCYRILEETFFFFFSFVGSLDHNSNSLMAHECVMTKQL